MNNLYEKPFVYIILITYIKEDLMIRIMEARKLSEILVIGD